MTISIASAALLATVSPLAGPMAGHPSTTVSLPVAMQQAAAVQAEPDDASQPLEATPEDAEVLPGEDESVASVEEDAAPPAPAATNEIVVTADSEIRDKDPLAGVNEATFELTQSVDKAFVEPIAEVYEDAPGPLRKGLRNFFRNLLEPVTMLNYLLQLKPGKALETAGRFVVNSTVGVAGLFDVAKKEPFNLPYRRNGFANTLGYYGVEPGPFLVLPLVGATTLRDLIGSGIDQSILPFAVGKPFNTPLYAVPAYTVNSLEFRIAFDKRLEEINTSDDPYFAMREIYLCEREADIAALKNRPPPRDCSIEAIMGLDEETVARLAAEVNAADPGIASSVAIEEQSIADEPVAPEPPAIVFVSEPVVQPLPADYVPASAPSN